MAKYSISEDGAILISEFVCEDKEYTLEIDRFSKKQVLVSYAHCKNENQIAGLRKTTIYIGTLFCKSDGLPLCKRGYTECLLVNFESLLRNVKEGLFHDTEKTLIFEEETGMRVY